MTFKDIIKKSVYENMIGGTGLDIKQIGIILLISCLLGIYIFCIYKFFSKSAFYSKDLNITIAGMSVVVAAIMIAMQSNLLVSLGMVGALSIVRFRTAIKNPIDLLYLFWSISVGIICGVGLYTLGIIVCVTLTLLIFILGKMPTTRSFVVLDVKTSIDIDVELIEKEIRKTCKYSHLSSDSIRNKQRELIYEVRCKDKSIVVTSISALVGVSYVNCMEHDGEIRS